MSAKLELLSKRSCALMEEQLDKDYGRKGFDYEKGTDTTNITVKTGVWYMLKVDVAGSRGVAFASLIVNGVDLSTLILAPGDVIYGKITSMGFKLNPEGTKVDAASVDCNVLLYKS